jgi:probable rRNA maturation factor
VRPARRGACDEGGQQLCIEICNRQRFVRVRKTWLAGLLARAATLEGRVPLQLSIAVVDDRTIAELHDTWLGVPGPTDVITFDLPTAESRGRSGPINGEIVASGETAARRGREYGWLPEQELAYYLVHGFLHLCGYDDTAVASRRAMRMRERSVMRGIGLPVPPRRPLEQR